ncbi:MAG: 3-deoxy-manno-octulosonate cytidylyltransferase (CMP-KDO synthetase) [Flavobacteriales bacterium]|jgi:3-deoxy-manno-octulosonate cytidylyltransferase (CMP-KDO synthetase)
MSFTVVIPARYASTRLPAKPLQDICGKSMIQRVWEQAKLCGASKVVIATDHSEIFAAAQEFGADVLMTRADHESGTDRLAEVVDALGLSDEDLVVNVQGDEPLIPPAVINQVAQNLKNNPSMSVATLSESVSEVSAYRNPNTVKVVADKNGRALYFSRAKIPFARDNVKDDEALTKLLMHEKIAMKHIGIYAYRASLLREFVQWPVAMLERVEKLEQLRVLENGHAIHVEEAIENVPGGVDTQEDLEIVRAIVAQ